MSPTLESCYPHPLTLSLPLTKSPSFTLSQLNCVTLSSIMSPSPTLCHSLFLFTPSCIVLPSYTMSQPLLRCHPLLLCVTLSYFISPHHTVCHPLLLYITPSYCVSPSLTLYHPIILCVTLSYFISPHHTLCHPLLLYITPSYCVSPSHTLLLPFLTLSPLTCVTLIYNHL